MLRAAPDSLAPERLLVFVVKGEVSNFVSALSKVQGLDLIDEDEIPAPEDGINSHLYLLMPDLAALKSIESLWSRWSRDEILPRGYSPWKELFSLLKDIRPWGAEDRLRLFDKTALENEIFNLSDTDKINIEVELVCAKNLEQCVNNENSFSLYLSSVNGIILSSAKIIDISYHGVLARLPVSEIKRLLSYDLDSIAGHDLVLAICPQSTASIAVSTEDVTDDEVNLVEQTPSDEPIVAILDGVPVARHPILDNRLIVDDIFDLEPLSQVNDRQHGTAMASLISRGDLNLGELPLSRKIHFIPVLGSHGNFPRDRLVIDLIYLSVLKLVDPNENPNSKILVINISLGNPYKIFDGRMSAWARLLDRLSYKYGVLFVVSAGNHTDDFNVQNVNDWNHLESTHSNERAALILNSLKSLIGYRRLLSPAESINALTVGAQNNDNILTRMTPHFDPYQTTKMSNPSSALGPGYANSVKPEVIFAGGKEHLRMRSSGGGVSVGIANLSHAHGLKVAWPPNTQHFSGGTSGAAALATRTCHLIHDALESVYGDEFLDLAKPYRASLLKALVVHTASWPEETVRLIEGVMNSANDHHSAKKNNIRRFIGYGIADPELAISCASDRATFWAVGELNRDKAREIEIPIPACISAKRLPHYIQATLAWISPVSCGRKAYKNVKLNIIKPDNIEELGISSSSLQPDANQSRKGTVISQCWSGSRAAVVGENQVLKFVIQRDPDKGQTIDDPVPFAIAITLSMPTVNEIYQEVRARLDVTPRVQT